jgi:SAM-dependent methyltransferase
MMPEDTQVPPSLGPTMESSQPWQLRMFSKTLKKQQKLALILEHIGDARGRRCLLVTHGDNNGALNYHLRAHGGEWVWVENEEDHIDEMAELLGEPVLKGSPTRIPAGDASCDIVVSIDVHEHLADCGPFNQELKRVTRPGGVVVVTTPNGDFWKPVTVLKHLIGMTREHYGHVVVGYNVGQHQAMLAGVGLEPVGAGSYSRFFTEMIELAINFAYVKVLARRGKASVRRGTIAPSNAEQLRAVERQYRMYALAHPFLSAVSRLDALLFFCTGYAVLVRCRRPA